MKKRLVALVLCVASILSLAACGTTLEVKNPAIPTDTLPITSGGEVNPLKKFDPIITMTTNRIQCDTYVGGDTAGKNDVYTMWEDIMGIKVENAIEAPRSAMPDKMQMAIAGDSIPDVGVVDINMMNLLIKNEMVEDLTPYYNTWATENLKSVLGQGDGAMFKPASKGGKIYGMPSVQTVGNYIPVLWIRSDWLKGLGMEAPKTMEEVLDLAIAFATKDPDGNGKNDTYGIFMEKTLSSLNDIASAFGVYSLENYWLKQADGSYIAACTDPNIKPVLEKLAALYKVGGIEPEFAIKDEDKEKELVAAGKLGIYFGRFYHPMGPLKDCIANVAGSDWIGIAPPAAQGKSEYVIGSPLNADWYFYVKKGFANPEALIVMLNHISDGYGAPWLAETETDFYKKYNELATNDKYRTYGDFNNLMPFDFAGNINWGDKFQEAVDSGASSVPGKDADYQRMIDPNQPAEIAWGWKKIYLEAYKTLDFDNLRYSDYVGATTPTMVKTAAMLEKEKLTAYTSIIMGKEPVGFFDKFVETYNTIGGKKISEEILVETK